MWRHGQTEPAGRPVDRFFADLPGTVEKRSGWLLADAAASPMTSLTEETLARARALSDDETLDLAPPSPGRRRRRAGPPARDPPGLPGVVIVR